MKKNRYFVRMIRVMAMMLALFTGAGGAWCTPAGMLTAHAKGMEKPTLNAAVSDGVLSIQAQSGDSVIQKIMVNGYEFDDIWNGTLNIRLQQFDASYPEFSIQVADQDGNWSETYKVANPYYKDPEQKEEGNGDSGTELPVSAVPPDPGSATAKVTEYENTGQGKEFYTIQTASEKTFYLIVDRDGENENVYFLTEISENDLLNATSGNSETLPKNSAALESAIPTSDGTGSNFPSNDIEETEENPAEEPAEQEKETSEKPAQPVIGYLVMGAAALVAVGAGYYLKVVRKKKEEFLDEDEDDEEEELYEEEENEDLEDDFFRENDTDSADDGENEKGETKGDDE